MSDWDFSEEFLKEEENREQCPRCGHELSPEDAENEGYCPVCEEPESEEEDDANSP